MKKRFILFLLVLFFGWLIGRQWWWRSPSPRAEAIPVVIESGQGVDSIAQELRSERIIGSPFLFKMYVRLAGASGDLKAGEYEMTRGMNASSVVQVLRGGTARDEITLTFLEGWTLREMGEYLVENGVVSEVEWNAAATSDLEGYLFPETYRFFADVTAQEIVDRMRSEFDRQVTTELRAEIDAQGKTLHEIVTMASIIEREVRGTEDRRNVSDIFWKRLDIGMALQADSTVNYITGKKTPSISFADRDIDSPYNTYQYRGLPPGPISAPSLDSIEAAIYPNSNPYFYFLTSPEGTVHYGRTLEEHVQNRVLYLR